MTRKFHHLLPYLKMKRGHYISVTSHDRRLQYCQQMTPNFLNSPALVGNKGISGEFTLNSSRKTGYNYE